MAIPVGLMVEGQEGLTWERWHELGDLAESLGFDSIWRSDHLFSLEGVYKRLTLEAWLSFATLATRTKKIRFGPMVTPVTFRHPSLLAKMAASIDRLSGGRLEMGLGVGWFDEEHSALGLSYPPTPERYDILGEQIEVIKALWTKDEVSFNGKHYQLDNATCYPKPIQDPGPPIVIGGIGERRTLPAVAKYADEWNGSTLNAQAYKARREILVSKCEEIGRDPTTLTYQVLTGIIVGHAQSELETRLQSLRAILCSQKPVIAASSPQDLIAHGWVVGTPSQVNEQLHEFIEAGAQRIMLEPYDNDDLEGLHIIGGEVIPEFAKA